MWERYPTAIKSDTQSPTDSAPAGHPVGDAAPTYAKTGHGAVIRGIAADVYLRACDLAIDLGHHLFDTLYHALALSLPRTELITADQTYYRQAAEHGCIRLLRDFGSN